jgi:hypothetical protein
MKIISFWTNKNLEKMMNILLDKSHMYEILVLLLEFNLSLCVHNLDELLEGINS